MAWYKKFQICSDSKKVLRFGICITLRAKMSPTPPLKSSGLPKYNNLGQISWCWKIVIFKNFKICSDSKTVSRFGICITLRAKMSPTTPLKSSGLPRYNNLGQISWCWKIVIFKNFKISSDSKTVSRFGICITLRAKMSPTPFLKSSGLPRYNNLGQISWCWKIVIFKNFKFAPIRKRFRDSGSASLCEQKCPPHLLSNPQGYRDTTI